MSGRLWEGRATIVCPVMCRTTNGHVNERDLSMKYLTIAAVAAAVLAWSPSAYAQGWRHCATEGGFCRAPAGAVIHYGREGAFARRRSPPGGLSQASTRNASCHTNAFSAPSPCSAEVDTRSAQENPTSKAIESAFRFHLIAKRSSHFPQKALSPILVRGCSPVHLTPR